MRRILPAARRSASVRPPTSSLTPERGLLVPSSGHVGDVAAAVDAVGAVRAVARLDGLGAGAVAGVALADRAGAGLDQDARELGAVAVVRVDARERPDPGNGHDVVELDVARVLLVAVAARTVSLAEVLETEVADDHRARAVVLEHLVGGGLRAAGVDRHRLAGRRTLQRRGVLADVLPPDVLQRAGAVAVNAVGGRVAD